MKTGSGKGADPGFGTKVMLCVICAKGCEGCVTPRKLTWPLCTLQICSVVLGVLVLPRLKRGVIMQLATRALTTTRCIGLACAPIPTL